jgi:hypothetical protein
LYSGGRAANEHSKRPGPAADAGWLRRWPAGLWKTL